MSEILNCDGFNSQRGKVSFRSTHTYVELELSQSAYDEIAKKLRDAGYDHAFGRDGEIDMHGLAVTKESAPTSAGVTVDPSGSLHGSASDIATFRQFASARSSLL